MTWRRYLQVQTREPAFLWRMVIGILLAGAIVGLAVDSAVTAWARPDAETQAGDPQEPPISDWGRLEELALQEQWFELALAIPRTIVSSWRYLGLTSLAVLTGFCWLAFAMQAIQIRNWRDHRLWAPLAAMGLGVLSIWPTVFLILWQEQAWGLEDTEELMGGVRYFVLGVGLREELAKFACYLPLLPLIVRRRDELAALVVPGCVGLGFAMEENIGYIAGSGGGGTLSRLLMPAPLHMAMSGLVGLAAYRACVWPKQCGPQLIAVFGVIVLAHGFYDSLAALPALVDVNFGAVIIFLGLVYQFFRELRPAQVLRVEPISLTANFLFCVSTVAAATFVYLCAAAGCQAAGKVLVSGIVAESIMVYLFLREMPETMVSV